MTFSLTILGSSSALPTSDRTVTAHVLNVHERFFLIDCGEGTQMQMRKYRIRFGKIHHIFISHLHGDHFYGLFGLISSLNLMGRKVPLNIYGPPQLRKFLDLHFSDSSVKLDYTLVFKANDMKKKAIIFEDKNIVVESFPLDHKIDCVGFTFREREKDRRIKKEQIGKLKLGIANIVALQKGEDYVDEDGKVYENDELTNPPPLSRTYAYCSDTRYYEKIVPWIRNVDLLYHEATYLEEMKSRAIQTGHSTAREAAEIAKKANARQLVIGHYSSRYKNLDPLLLEAQGVFSNTILAREGLTVEVKRRNESD